MLIDKCKTMMAGVLAAASITVVACDDGDLHGEDSQGYEFLPEDVPDLESLSFEAAIQTSQDPPSLEVPEHEPALAVYTQVSPFVDQIMAFKAVTPVPALLVVRGYDQESGTGEITDELLGYAIVEPGVTYDVAVDLNRPFEHKEVLWAGLYEDLGEIGAFDPQEDAIFVREWGADLAMTFRTYTHTPVSEFLFAQDQVLGGSLDEVNVGFVASDEEGWVAIYEDDGGAPGALLGYTAVPHEYSSDVAVSLERQATNGEELWAVLHDDLGVVGDWEPLVDLQAEEPCPGVTAVTFTVTVI